MGHYLCKSALTFLLVSPWLSGSVLGETAPVRLVLIGNSYISSHGVPLDRTFDVQLEKALNASGSSVQVVGSGYTATASKGVERLKSLLETENVLGGAGQKAVILELGSNDCFRHTLEETQTSLDAILKTLADQRIPVLVAGTTPYDTCPRKDWPNHEVRYVQMFADLAAKYGGLYYKDFKEGVGDHPELMQSDRDHPTAEGDAVIVSNILPIVRELVARAQR